MIKKKEKNIFINCDKGFFKAKPDRNANFLVIQGFKRHTWRANWLPLIF